MALSPGSRLGVHEVVAAIGEGGMGQVYRARDTKLNRDVALKVLPDSFATDPDRLARFTREAQTLASLNHPHIAAIYGLEDAGGVSALVMELVEGEDLSRKIEGLRAKGQGLPLDEALPIARQIAEALEAAHEQGIVHRDLKPANIMVRSDGTVKVLDFGLAKAVGPSKLGPYDPGTGGRGGLGVGAELAPPEMSPTITTPAMMTGIGVILGTAAYMSPEQARGKAADRRADVWAFGCILLEMLTGRRAFAGDEVSDVLASVLAREPDLASLPPATPPSIRRLLRRCLEKDRRERLRDIGDARIEIRDALAGVEPAASVQPLAGAVPSRRLAWLGALGVVLLAAGATLGWRLRPPAAAPEMRLDISTPPTTSPMSVAMSPDGRTIAFVATAEGRSRLWLRSLESGSARPIKGTEGAEAPFWSPDSRSIGFFFEGKLCRVDVQEESARVLAVAISGQQGAWNRDGVILFSSLGSPIARVPATGGRPVPLAGLAQQGGNFAPHFLPDGHHFLYYVRGAPDARGVYVGDLDGPPDPRRLLDADSGAAYAPSGHLLFLRQETLFAQPFDPATRQLNGTPIAVAERAARVSAVSVSSGGSIAYRANAASVTRQFVWFDRAGKLLTQVGDPITTTLSGPSLSPDEQRVALYRPVNGNVDIWLLDLKRAAYGRFTTDAADDVVPVWSPRGDRIAFSSNRSGVHNLYLKPVSTGASEALLLATTERVNPSDWSADGRFVLFNRYNATQSTDIWAVPIDGDRKPFPVVQTAFDELNGQFSPDGRWVAFQSNESGRPEIYVQPFGAPGSHWPVSTRGGTQARWRRDGRELFYVAADGRLMAVQFGAGSNSSAPELGTASVLFAPPFGGAAQQGDFRTQYMVSSDGQQFLVAAVNDDVNAPITVIVNWKPRTTGVR